MTNPLSWGLLLACVHAYPIFIRLLGFLLLVKPSEARLSSSFETPSLGAVTFCQHLKQAVGLQAVALQFCCLLQLFPDGYFCMRNLNAKFAQSTPL